MDDEFQRWKLTIEYDGTDYCGWQRQENGPTIQSALEQAANALCKQDIIMHGSGRTDAGVHALGQVAHCDLPKNLRQQNVIGGLNFYLGDQPIAVRNASKVDSDFHARYHARMRHYCYRLMPSAVGRSALDNKRVWHVRAQLDIAAMHTAASALIGLHDFTSFRAAQCQADNPVRTLERLDIKEIGDDFMHKELHIHARARSFLHHQVRNIVGTLVDVGIGRLPADAIGDILAARERASAGVTAPAHGLYFLRVSYEK